MQRTRILVTGASGLLGANFIAAAAGAHDVIGVSLNHRFAWPGTQWQAVDLRSAEATAQLFQAARPDVVAHFAAATNVDRCETYPAEAEQLNVLATANTVAAACAVGVRRFVFMSTDSVFDGNRGGYDEDAKPAPINRYAKSKLAAEQLVRESALPHLIVRGNLYGWNAQAKDSLAEWVLRRLEQEAPVPGFTDVTFAPLLANTLSELILALVERQADGTVHLASRDVLSKYDFAVAVAAAFGYPASRIQPASATDVAFQAPRPRNTALRSRRLESQFGLLPPRVADDLAGFAKLRQFHFADRLKSSCTPWS